MARQPLTGTREENVESKHGKSSKPPSGSPGSVEASAHMKSDVTVSQYSKCPISSEPATLYVCAAHDERVAFVEVSNSGWNEYGFSLHLLEFGWKRICLNPLAALAVIEPVLWLVRSFSTTLNP